MMKLIFFFESWPRCGSRHTWLYSVDSCLHDLGSRLERFLQLLMHYQILQLQTGSTSLNLHHLVYISYILLLHHHRHKTTRFLQLGLFTQCKQLPVFDWPIDVA